VKEIGLSFRHEGGTVSAQGYGSLHWGSELLPAQG
jgi:hypothetical protein